jgi:hypothetical protein
VIVGVDPKVEIDDEGVSRTNGRVTMALRHALSVVRPGVRHSVLSVTTRALQWLRRDEKQSPWLFGSISRNSKFRLDFDGPG